MDAPTGVRNRDLKVISSPSWDSETGFFMELFEAIKSRQAVREYTKEPLTVDAIEALINIAIRAPSAMNLQPWSFAVVRGTERLHDMSQRCKKYALEHIPSTSKLYSHLTNPNFEIFHNAPTLIIVCAQDAQAQSAEDCCLAAHNIMLAACAQSLGTCWIGLARQWLNQAEIKAELGIPASMVPVAPIIVGHPGGKIPPTPREPARIIWCLEDHMPVMVST